MTDTIDGRFETAALAFALKLREGDVASAHEVAAMTAIFDEPRIAH
ncbi:hypothetical protein IV454_19585 [Massilia antarctica]|uniref:Uncharacterized protein n=1 Tax=Massilia antarctica TaxID=2765360 RepID=A0AA49A649_9BURK|nr:hypothetical protein [Massilia antarctica]QPI47776.1 hypothetical protein IV454_19585 [Massilia antarctica]